MNTQQGYLLVVEDIPDILKLLETALSFKGYRVVTARNGEEALEAIQKERPQMIVSDILMPKMDGFSLLHRLRINSDTRKIPVVFLSAKGQDSEIQTGLDLGAEEYLLKPFAPDQLTERVKVILAKFGK